MIPYSQICDRIGCFRIPDTHVRDWKDDDEYDRVAKVLKFNKAGTFIVIEFVHTFFICNANAVACGFRQIRRSLGGQIRRRDAYCYKGRYNGLHVRPLPQRDVPVFYHDIRTHYTSVLTKRPST